MIGEDELQAFIDDRLDGERRAAVEAKSLFVPSEKNPPPSIGETVTMKVSSAMNSSNRRGIWLKLTGTKLSSFLPVLTCRLMISWSGPPMKKLWASTFSMTSSASSDLARVKSGRQALSEPVRAT